MLRKRKTDNPPFPVRAGMGEHGLAYVLIRNREGKTPWLYGDNDYGTMRWHTVDAIVNLRAHGLREREVIAEAKRYVSRWFESGSAPKPFGNAAVRALALSESEYPFSKARLAEVLTLRGFSRNAAAAEIADAERQGLIQAKRGRIGSGYYLTHEPRTRAVTDLAERVADMMTKHPDGMPFSGLRHVACRLVFRGIEAGAALIERGLNAGLLRAEIRGTGRNRERFIFPNVTNKAKGGKSC